MDRRLFFKNLLAKTVNAGVDVLEQRAQSKAKRWFRPPFAKSELDFLLACTRCNACVEACPHQVIFALPLRCGADVVGTPALDLVNKGCHLCPDWACVTACKDNSLVFPPLALSALAGPAATPAATPAPKASATAASEPTTLLAEPPAPLPTALDCPPLGKATVNTTLCITYNGPECGACRGSCPIPKTLLWQGEKPYINADSCVGCGLCREACITSPKAIDITPFLLASNSQTPIKASHHDQ